MISKNIEYYQPRVGMMSMVGVGRTNFPLSFGNYFWLSGGPRIINFWAENLKEFINQNPNFGKVKCLVYSHGDRKLGLIADERIPTEWYIQDKFCVTGCGWGSRELCENILNDHGFSIENHICGCEKPEESPSLSQSFSFGNPVTTYCCMKCHRNWSN